MIANTTIRQQKTIHFAVSTVRPNRRKQATNSSPVASSTSGYIAEIGCPHERHLPRSHSQPKTGTLSYGLIGVRQRGQRELGDTTDNPSGIRAMQTFRKLPNTIPNKKKIAINAATLRLCHSARGVSTGTRRALPEA